jgi:hypothetical protein
MHSDLILLLWSDRFDEAATAIFATELRQAGLAVKVVGLAGHQAAGSSGLVLGADLTLGPSGRWGDFTLYTSSRATDQQRPARSRVAATGMPQRGTPDPATGRCSG